MLKSDNNSNPLLDFPYFAENFLKIRSKSGDIKPLKLNRAQRYAHGLLENQLKTTGKVRAIILKGRQQGMSTMISGRFAHKTVTRKGMKAFILTHEADATANLFEMTKRYIDNLPEGLCPKPDTSSANKLFFKAFESGYSVGTAGNKNTGRSLTIQLMHGSECAFWPTPEDTAKGVMQAVPGENGTEIIIESTANGIGNYFHNIWLSAIYGKSEYIPIFVPWYWQDEYTSPVKDRDWSDEELQLLENHGSDGLTEAHLQWRRYKIAESGNDIEKGTNTFKQEYPFTWEESFRSSAGQPYIDSGLVLKARNNKIEDADDLELIIGVDIGIKRDKASIIRRRGRKSYNLQVLEDHNTMEIAGVVADIIDTERPKKVFIDVIGIGAGVVDRLHERGYWDVVEGVNASSRANQRLKFHNKRAELWHEANEFFNNPAGVEIPDDEALHGELCNIGYKRDSGGRLQMESKEDMEKRGLKSPDRADSLCLTFSGGKMINIESIMPSANDMVMMQRDSSMFF